jgi:hypothetical protein
VGSGLGSGGFIVFDHTADLSAVCAGVSRFLAVESCGQCSACKADGVALAELLAKLSSSKADDHDLAAIEARVSSVADGARCYLATQHQVVVGSLLARFGTEVQAHLTGGASPAEPELITELVDIDGDVAVLNERHRAKQPDWTYGQEWSGKWPAEELDDHRLPEALPE